MPAHCCAGGIALEQPDGMRRIIPIEDDQRTAIASSKDGARSGHGRAPAARTSVALFLLSAWPNKSASRSRAAPIDKLPTEAHPGGRRLAYATPAAPDPFICQSANFGSTFDRTGKLGNQSNFRPDL